MRDRESRIESTADEISKEMAKLFLYRRGTSRGLSEDLLAVA